jgi:hypothetical protein
LIKLFGTTIIKVRVQKRNEEIESERKKRKEKGKEEGRKVKRIRQIFFKFHT